MLPSQSISVNLRFETEKKTMELIRGMFLHHYEINAFDLSTNQKVGCISLDGKEVNRIGYINVVEPMRQKGVAKALLAQAIKFARQHEKDYLYWDADILRAPVYAAIQGWMNVCFGKLGVVRERRTEANGYEHEVTIYHLLKRLD